MAAEPEVIRTQIENTREELAYDIDRLADRTNPKRIAQRRWDSVRSRIGDARDRVMGVSHDTVDRVRDTTQETVSDVSSSVREAPEALARKTQGNPIAVGLIAFGAGLLAASLLPETDAERRMGREIGERAGDLVEPLKETGRQMAADVGESVKEASSEVKETAKEAAATTAQRAKETAGQA